MDGVAGCGEGGGGGGETRGVDVDEDEGRVVAGVGVRHAAANWRACNSVGRARRDTQSRSGLPNTIATVTSRR